MNQLTLSPSVVASHHEGGVVLLHMDAGRLFTSNASGTLVYDGLQRGLTVESIALELSRRYEIDEATALADIRPFIDNLTHEGLLSHVSGAR